MSETTVTRYNPYRKDENGQFCTKAEATAKAEHDYQNAVFYKDKDRQKEIAEFIMDNAPESDLGEKLLSDKYGMTAPLSKQRQKALAMLNDDLKNFREDGITGKEQISEFGQKFRNIQDDIVKLQRSYEIAHPVIREVLEAQTETHDEPKEIRDKLWLLAKDENYDYEYEEIARQYESLSEVVKGWDDDFSLSDGDLEQIEDFSPEERKDYYRKRENVDPSLSEKQFKDIWDYADEHAKDVCFREPDDEEYEYLGEEDRIPEDREETIQRLLSLYKRRKYLNSKKDR